MSNIRGGAVTCTRRSLLGLAAVALLYGCAPPLPHRAVRAATVGQLVSSPLFYVAHRGSGDNWPEHTLLAYRSAVRSGAQAIEVSVHRTADGEFVCHHDASLLRLTGVDLHIEDVTWPRLRSIVNDARRWLGPNSPLEPIPRLTSVLDELAGSCFLFIEDKTGRHAKELLAMLDRVPGGRERIVWKQNSTAAGRELAAEHGYLTWGYFAPDTLNRVQELAGGFDLLGIHDSATDQQVRRMLGFGKPVICWEIHTRWQRDHFTSLGVQGMMCSNYPYVTGDGASSAALRDSFETGLRAVGDLPDAIAWQAQPIFVLDQQAIRLSGKRKSSYTLGSLSAGGAPLRELRLELRWPELSRDNHVAGAAFSVPSDRPYRAFESGQIHGMHVQLESRGEVSLWRSAQAGAQKVLQAQIPPTRPGQWVEVLLRVHEAQLELFVDGRPVGRVQLRREPRIGYISVLTLIPQGLPVEFRRVAVEAWTDSRAGPRPKASPWR